MFSYADTFALGTQEAFAVEHFMGAKGNYLRITIATERSKFTSKSIPPNIHFDTIADVSPGLSIDE